MRDKTRVLKKVRNLNLNSLAMEELVKLIENMPKKPVGIEVNPDWLQMQIYKGNVVNKPCENVDINLLSSVRVFFNETIDSYKFIY